MTNDDRNFETEVLTSADRQNVALIAYTIERIVIFNSFGVHVSSDFPWNCNFEDVAGKASRTLCFLL